MHSVNLEPLPYAATILSHRIGFSRSSLSSLFRTHLGIFIFYAELSRLRFPFSLNFQSVDLDLRFVAINHL